MRGIIRAVFMVLLMVGLLLTPGAHGQGGATGAISGTVVDINGGTVADADVQIINTATESACPACEHGSGWDLRGHVAAAGHLLRCREQVRLLRSQGQRN